MQKKLIIVLTMLLMISVSVVVYVVEDLTVDLVNFMLVFFVGAALMEVDTTKPKDAVAPVGLQWRGHMLCVL